MTTRSWAALLSLLLVTGAAGAARAAEPDLTVFREVAKEFAEAWNKNDAVFLSSFWADDGDLIDPHGQVVKTKAGVEKYFTAGFAGPLKGSTNVIKVESVRMLGNDYAVVDWSAVMTLKAPDGKAQEHVHHVTLVMQSWVKTWRIVAARPVLHPPAPGK